MLSEKINAKVFPPWVLKVSKQLDVIICIAKYFLMEKMPFLPMPNICFHDAQIFWNNIFSVSSQETPLTIITF